MIQFSNNLKSLKMRPILECGGRREFSITFFFFFVYFFKSDTKLQTKEDLILEADHSRRFCPSPPPLR